MVRVKNRNMGGPRAEPGGGPTHDCPLCKVTGLTKEQFHEHKAGKEHTLKWLKHWYNSNRILLAQNKNGVEVGTPSNVTGVNTDLQTGLVAVTLRPGTETSFQLVVRNTSRDPVVLRQIEALHACPTVTVTDNYGVCRGERFVRVLGGVNYEVQCRTVAQALGVEQVPIAFQFKTEASDELFFIVRTVQVHVQDIVAEESAPTSLFERPVAGPNLFISSEMAVPGVPLKEKSENGLSKKVSLKPYKYSQNLSLIARKNFNPKKVTKNLVKEATRLQSMMKGGLQAQNYRDWFQTLLWIEEMQMELDIRFYSMEDAQLKRVPLREYSAADCVELRVPGLAENRPSVLRNDNVLVTLSGKKRPVYAGVVHQVKENSLYLAFNPQFMATFIDNMKVCVSFEYNRHSLMVCHRALEMTVQSPIPYLTFPTQPPYAVASVQDVRLYNQKLSTNREQLWAVRNIVSGISRPAPYVVFGPPGTGKTVTIVEAMKQVFNLYPESRILACTPSNSAADLIALRVLEHVPRQEMFRMHASSRLVCTIPEQLLPISNIRNRHIYYPNEVTLGQYRIIVCTMVTAARLVSGGFSNTYFSHIFLDESGHSSEPEALVALSGLATQTTQVVLAGDPHQLGPVIRNTQCFSSGSLFSNNGLDKSYLERLMEAEVYKPHVDYGYNAQVITKLLCNYRSHSAILKKPNDFFYNSELKVSGDQMLLQSLCRWEHLPKRNFPLIFHAVKGKDEREGKSPSYFNPQEVSAVVEWVKKLLGTKSPKIAAKDIGVITPYRRQVEKIRTQIRKVRGAQDLKVGSPEEFQGDERMVIIISTVRASQDKMADDHVFKLGFLRNPKRFNVAVTRTKALLIVVGCPEILSLDKYWGELLRYIQQGGGYMGHAYTQTDDIDDVIARFDTLDLRPVLGEGVSAREMAEGPQWRSEY